MSCRLRSKHLSVLVASATVGLFLVAEVHSHQDPPPLPEDVMTALAPSIASSPDKSVQTLAAMLEHITTTLDTLERSSMSATSEIDRGLLRALRADASRIRSDVIPEDLPYSIRQKLAAKFRRLDGLLSEVQNASDPESRSRATQRLKELVNRWLGKGEDWSTDGGPLTPTFVLPPARPAPKVQRAPTPAYALESTDTNDRLLLASLGDVAVTPAATPVEAATCSYSSADLQTEQAEVDLSHDQEIRALAAKLQYNPVRFVEYLSNEIEYEAYFGSLKGAAGTLTSRAGNAHDQASLLIALLRVSNVPARYVLGEIEVRDPQPLGREGRINRWLGVKDYAAAEQILAVEGLLTGRVANAIGATTGLRLLHVWVEACLPYSNYRGSRITNEGHRWIPLDTSFKDRRYQPGIQHGVTFDLPAYLVKRTNGPDSLPHEVYAERVEAGVRALPPRYANNSIDEVGYRGQTVQRRYDILPSSLPYRVLDFHQWDVATNPSAETAQLPYNHRLHLWMRVEGPNGEVLLEHTAPMPETVLKRLTLSFKGVTDADRSALDTWRAEGSLAGAEPACSIKVMPSLKLEGAQIASGVLGVDFCEKAVTVTINVRMPSFSGGTSDPRCLFSDCVNGAKLGRVEAANLYAIHVYGRQASDELIASRASRLIAAVRAHPTDPNGDLEETQGEFLHLVGLKYMRYIERAGARIGELMGAYVASGFHIGVTTSRSKIGYLFDLPYAINRTGYLIDFPGGQFSSYDLTTGAPRWDAFFLLGRTASAYESYVWQENSRLDAVSTMRGLQFAKETGVGLITATKSNWATVSATLKTNYPGLHAKLQDDVLNRGATVIIPTRSIKYGDWSGYVYLSESAQAGRATYAISGGYSGGYTTAQPIRHYAPVIGANYSLTTPYDPPQAGSVVAPSAPPALVSSAVNFGTTPYNSYSGDPVNMVTGNMYHTETDISIPTRGGLQFVFQRSYNSRKAADGPLGWGWTHSFHHYLVVRDDNANEQADTGDTDKIPSSVIWVDGTGAEKQIKVAGGSATAGIPAPATFTTPAGYYFKLTRLADTSYQLREKNGLTYTFEKLRGLVGDKAKLARITDRNGNGLMLSYDTGGNLAAITDDLGRALRFQLAQGTTRIREVSDWTGRRWRYGYDSLGHLSGVWRSLDPDASPPALSYEYFSAADGENLEHMMRRYRLPRGNSMEFEYYTNGRVFRHRNTLGESITFSYNDFRRETVQINERGLERRLFFNKDGLLIKLIEENGGTREYTYDTTATGRFNLIKTVDPRGNETTYAYNANGDLILTTLPSGATVDPSYFNAFGSPGMVKDERGIYTVFKYDTKGNLTQQIRLRSGVGTDVVPSTYAPVAADIMAWRVFTYDVFGNQVSARSVRNIAQQVSTPSAINGPTLTTTFDASQVYPVALTRRGDKTGDGAVDAQDPADTVNLAFDTLGRAVRSVDEGWEARTLQYDDLDRIVSVQDATGNVKELFYDPNGNLVRETISSTSNGRATLLDSIQHEYDQSDRRIKTIASGGAISSFEYDATGNVVKTVTADGYATTAVYDELNRAVAIEDEEGNRVAKDLDIDGRPLSVTDPNGLRVTFDYYDKAEGMRLKRVTQPKASGFAAGRAVEYDYDLGGNTTKTIVLAADASPARITLTSYNELNRPTRIVGPVVTDPVNGKIRPLRRYTYDKLGRVTKVDAGRTDSTGTNTASDVLKVQVTYVWDDFGRKLKETDAAGRSWLYRYDTAGNVVQLTDPNGKLTTLSWQPGNRLHTKANDDTTVVFARNALGQPLSVENTSPRYTQSFGYDDAHRPVYVHDSRGDKTLHYQYSVGGRLDSMRDSEGGETNYLYDPVGRLTGIWTPTYDYFTFGYDRGGRLTEKWASNGVRTEYAYGDDGPLTAIRNLAGSTEVSRHAYAYDPWGNRKEHAEMLQGAELIDRYDYDELNRLIKARSANGATETVTGQYRYDIWGNRTRVTDAAGNYQAYVYDTTGLNQLTRIDSYTAANKLGGTIASFTYDLNGNLTGKTSPGMVQSFVWNADNLIATASTQTGSAATLVTTVERYSYDHAGRRISRSVNDELSQYLYNGPDIHHAYGASWTQAASRFAHGPATDDPLMVETASGRAFYHADGLGTPSLLTNESGVVRASRRHDPWGKALSGSGPTEQYGYTGREPDPTTGLMYYRARYYDPSIGRFISRDPIGITGGMNLYAYVENNPVNLRDPSGLVSCLPSCADSAYSGAPLIFADAGGARGTTTDAGSVAKGSGSSAWLRAIVPGQAAWDNSVNSFQQGSYGRAAGYLGIMLGEQVTTALTFGTSSLVAASSRAGIASASGIANSVAATQTAVAGTALVPKATTSLGSWGEVRLSQVLNNVGIKPTKPFLTSDGPRYFDRLAGGIAHEAKAGVNVGLTPTIQRQILKDAELIERGRIQGAHWHFFQGAQPELLRSLDQYAIQYTLH